MPARGKISALKWGDLVGQLFVQRREGQLERCTVCSWAQLKVDAKRGGAKRWVVRVIMPSGSRDQWNLIRVESWAARVLARLSDFPRWSGLLCEHRGIAEYHLRSQEAQDAYISHSVSSRVRSTHVLDPPSSALPSCLND